MDAPTFIVVPASDVPPGLADFRRKHIHHPGATVPFHTTLLAPFVDLDEFERDGLSRLRKIAARLSPFQYIASSLCTFPTTAVLWLAPSPVGAFEHCCQAIYDEFPRVRPERGFPTFHMTVGLTRTAEELASVLREFQTGFSASMPLHLHATELAVYIGVGEGYELHSLLPMGAR